jgi:glycosyltransferase involved in cell wall biosynthesis
MSTPAAERLRVLFLAHAYPRFAGDPVGSFVANLAIALRDRDVDVIVSAPGAPGLAPREAIDGIAVHRFRYAPRRAETLAYAGTMSAQVKATLGGKLAMGAYLLAAAAAARGLIRRERIQLVHAHWWFPAGLIAAGLRRVGGVPFVTTLHGSDLRLASSVPMGERLFGSVVRSAGGVTAVSSWLASGARSLVPGLEVTVAPMPVLAPLFTPPAPGAARDPGRMLFVGKLTEQKGLHRLLDAMSRMSTPARLTVVGAGRVEDGPLRARAVSLGLDARSEWLPLLSQGALADQYRRAAVHVVPALDEGLGLTAVESLLCETPVVGFASGGLPDIVHDFRSGRLVAPGDLDALARALDDVLGDDVARIAMGDAGREDTRRAFSPAAAAQRYAELYRRVCTRMLTP